MVFLTIFAVNTWAQVVIGDADEPNPSAILELKSDKLGFLPPRVELQSLNLADPLDEMVNGMVVFNTKTDLGAGLIPGLYYCDGDQWNRLTTASGTLDWFYLPAIRLEVSTGEHSVNLFNEYKRQVDNPIAVSDNNLSNFPSFFKPEDFIYIVLDCDKNVFDVKEITEEGLLTYEIIAEPDGDTPPFMTIILALKRF
jgi:hypothetical protein